MQELTEKDHMDAAIVQPAGWASLVSGGTWQRLPWLELVNAELFQIMMARLNGESRFLLMMAPPQHGKTTIVGHALPCAWLGCFPDDKIILASYEAETAEKRSKAARDTFDEFGPKFFGRGVDPSASAAANWGLQGKSGTMIARGVGGAITGEPCNLFIIDDPIKEAKDVRSQAFRDDQWEWFMKVAMRRLRKGSSMVVIYCMTGDTPVLMADGTERPLRDIRRGDVVATYKNGRISTSRVSNWANQGSDCIYEIRMNSGRIVRANERHPFLVETNGSVRWVRLRDLMVGDEIVAVTPNGGRCLGPHAPRMNATDQQSARVSVSPITTRRDGLMEFALRQSILNPGVPLIYATGMGLRSRNTTQCLRSSPAYVRSADNRQMAMFLRVGEESFASTMTTVQGKCEGSCAITAISSSDMEKLRQSSCQPLGTFGTTLDRIVSIVPAGREDVFDLEVEETENFIANGLVSHNTPWHEDDLGQRIIRASVDRLLPPFKVLRFPAIAETQEDRDDWAGDLGLPLGLPDPGGRNPGEALWPEVHTLESLQLWRRADPAGFEALAQGRPRPAGGFIFQSKWFRQNTIRLQDVPKDCEFVRSWDKASSDAKGDWSVSVLMGRSKDGRYFIVNVTRDRVSAFRRNEKIVAVAEADAEMWGSVHIHGDQDPGSAGKDDAEAFKRLLDRFWVTTATVSGDKETRARPFASSAEGGNVYLVRGSWNDAYLSVLESFPKGKHDDDVDASSSSFNLLAKQDNRLRLAKNPLELYDGLMAS